MNLLIEAGAWLTDIENWTGTNGIPLRILQHLVLTAAALAIAAAVALPIGVLIGHLHRGAGLVGALSGAARAIPTLGLLTLFGLAFGIGVLAPLLALVILAIPSLLAGAYAGVQSVKRSTSQAARAIGMTPSQVVFRVELPLASPVIIGGFRTAALQVVATATLAAYVTDLGLGRYLFSGLKSRDYPEMLGGALLVIGLALILEVLLSGCQRLAIRRFARPAHTPSRRRLRASP